MTTARRDVLLTLLDTLGGEVAKLDFQKLLLLYTMEMETKPSFEFVPYKYGCFSFTSYADRRKLIAQGLLAEDDQKWLLTPAGRAASQSRGDLRQNVALFCSRYQSFRGNSLIALTYRRFPYYATRSEIVNEVLRDPQDRRRVDDARPAPQGGGLVTIGYEGKTPEAYLNQLLREGVSVLCDVRRNPLSRKYGFSKGTLSHACEGLGIRYEHIPELGIASERRRALGGPADYAALFAEYERMDLPQQGPSLDRIASWIRQDGERVALTCFELHPQQCHRYCVAKAVAVRLGMTSGIRHLEGACQRNDCSLP